MEQFESNWDTSQRDRLKISEQQYAEFSTLISTAVINQSKIKVTLFNKNGHEYIIGVPVLSRGFQIQTDAGTMVRIPTDRIADIRALSRKEK